jgi:hypothetical protein
MEETRGTRRETSRGHEEEGGTVETERPGDRANVCKGQKQDRKCEK